jgi:membrane-associated protease RseP (regulator of RpoE activity)
MKQRSALYLVILLTCGSTALAGSGPMDVAGLCGESGSAVQRIKYVGGRLGVRLQGLTPQLAEFFGLSRPAGALISRVEADSPASKAGLMAGDVIISIGGERVEDPYDASRTIRRKPAGAVEIVVVRDKQEKTFTAQLEKSDGAWVIMPFNRKGVMVTTPTLKIKPVKIKTPVFKMKAKTRAITRIRPPRVTKPSKALPRVKVKPVRAKKGTVLL